MATNNQQARLLSLLREGPVTPLQAWIQIGCYRLSDTVFKLRGKGYDIDMHLKPFTTARGYKVKFAEYVLVSEPNMGMHMPRANVDKCSNHHYRLNGHCPFCLDDLHEEYQDDGDPYCQCGNDPYEEEEASGVCSSCGKELP